MRQSSAEGQAEKMQKAETGQTEQAAEELERRDASVAPGPAGTRGESGAPAQTEGRALLILGIFAFAVTFLACAAGGLRRRYRSGDSSLRRRADRSAASGFSETE